MAGFADLLSTLAAQDFFIGVLPFVITYAIFYLTLTNAPKFKESERISALVALSIAFFVSYFVVSSTAYQQFFVTYFGTLTIGLLGIMGLFVAFALTGLHTKVNGAYWWGIPVIILVAVAWTVSGGLTALTQGNLAGFTANGQILVNALNYMINTGLIWGVLVLGILAYTAGETPASGDNTSSGDGNLKNFINFLGKTAGEEASDESGG